MKSKIEEVVTANLAFFIVWILGFNMGKQMLCVVAACCVVAVLLYVLFVFVKNYKKASVEDRTILIKELIHQTVYSGCIISMHFTAFPMG